MTLVVEWTWIIGVGFAAAVALFVMLFDPIEVWDRIADWRNER
jgi:hypothetical protein